MADEIGDIGRRLRRQAKDAGRHLQREARQVARQLRDEAIAAALEPLTPARRRAMTRQHLLDAAAIVFSRDGFHGASLDTIAATAGFTKGAVYSNFKSKDDLFLALMDEHIEEQFADITNALDTESRTQEEQLPRIAQTVVQRMWDDRWTMLWLEFVLYAARNPDAREKVADLTRRARERIEELIEKEYARHGGSVPPYSPQQMAVISSAMFDGLGMYHLIDPSLATDETIETLLRLLYQALGVNDAEVPEGKS